MDDRFSDQAVAMRRIRGAANAFAEARLLAKETARAEGEELPRMLVIDSSEDDDES